MLTASQFIYYEHIRKAPPTVITEGGVCPICGGALYDRTPYKLSEKFTNYDMLHSFPVTHVCAACHWFLRQDNAELASILDKDKCMQGARSYGFIAGDDELFIGSKAHKREWRDHLLALPFPRVAIIPDTCKKHSFLFARLNPSQATGGWVTFETDTFYVESEPFGALLSHTMSLYAAGFNKQAILTGDYAFYPNSDFETYQAHEPYVAPTRGTQLLALAVYLTTKDDEQESDKDDD